jgi:hypothetical protein
MGLDDNTARPEPRGDNVKEGGHVDAAPADESVALTPDQQLLTEIRDLLREQRA